MMLHPELLRAARIARGPLLGATGGLAAVAVTHLAQAVLLATALAAVARGETDRLPRLLGAVLAVVVARALLSRWQRRVAVRAGATVRVRLRDALVEHLGRIGALGSLGPGSTKASPGSTKPSPDAAQTALGTAQTALGTARTASDTAQAAPAAAQTASGTARTAPDTAQTAPRTTEPPADRRQRAGAVRATLVDGVEGVDAYVSRYLPQLVITCVVPPLLLVAVAAVQPYALLVLVPALLLALLAPRWWDRLLTRRGRDHWDTYEALAADYLEALQGMPALRAAGAVRRTRERLERRSAALHRATVAKLRVSLVDTGLTDLAVQGGTAAAALLAVASAASGRTSATGTYLLLMLASECFRPIRDLSREWHAGYLGVSAADGIAALRTAEGEVPDEGTLNAPWAPPAASGTASSSVTAPPGSSSVTVSPASRSAIAPPGSSSTFAPLESSPPPTAPEIRFENVHFRYPGADRPALAGVSFTAEAGRTTAVVGPSGAGKSTLLALLLRHRDPQRGRVLLDGVDAAAYTLESLRRGIAVVSQETYLFHATVAENLRLGRPDATDAELRAAARTAGVHEEIERLPDGYATVVGERGGTLSGGQRQRLALARALLADAPVLVLDEATSAVDEHRETRIGRELAQAVRGRTCLVVAHRLASVRHADRIVVLDGGRVDAVGDHAGLLAEDGVYASLVAAGRTDPGAYSDTAA
ncbi:ABC transporter ATP-binding protein [Streptomyces sp. NPDC003077]|uniref:ABC transporter ATP-binding protein/permease n=1 Tax=Streptomyces sp. NPDC003077 TaxID=3154443 RepID=UPI0033A6F7A0